MPAPLLELLRLVEISGSDAASLGMASGEITLKRAWPISGQHLALEYTDSGQRVLAAQWHAGDAELQHLLLDIHAHDQKAAASIVRTAAGRLLLQTGGADARLRPLRGIVARPGSTLLVHRASRRAVVRIDSVGDICFAKVVRPKKVNGIVSAYERIRTIAGGNFDVPELRSIDPSPGVCVWSPLAGRAVHEELSSPGLPSRAEAIGAALLGLHCGDPQGLTQHRSDDEAAVLRDWLERTAPFNESLARRLEPMLDRVIERLISGQPGLVRTIHRDLHDKQVFITEQRRVGFLDMDLLAAGEAELDLANFLVHLELREIQGMLIASAGAKAAAAFLAGYNAPISRERLRAYADAARLRLACVYSFRPHWAGVPDALQLRIGTPPLMEGR